MLDSWGRPSRLRVASTPWRCWPAKAKAWSRSIPIAPRYPGAGCSGARSPGPDCSGVPPHEDPAADDHDDRGIERQGAGRRPRRHEHPGEVRLAGGDHDHGQTEVGRQVPLDRVADARGEDLDDQREHQEQPDVARERTGGVPEDEADPEGDDGEEDQVDATEEHGTCGPGAGDAGHRDRRALELCHDRAAGRKGLPPVRRQHGLADEERGERRQLGHHEDHRRDDDALGRQHGGAARNGGQGRPDRAGGVLRGHDQCPEDADDELGDELTCLGEPDGVELGAVHDAQAGPPAGLDVGYQRREPDSCDHDDGQGDPRRSHRAQLGPLGEGLLSQAGAAALDRGQRRGDRRHEATPTRACPWKSTESEVSSMKTSSRLACCGLSSWRAMPAACAASPIRAGSAFVTRRLPSSPGATDAPIEVSASASLPASGERTRTVATVLDLIKSSTVVSAMSFPRTMTTRSVAVSDISLIRWLETKIVLPSPARDLSRVRTHRIPSGSRPLTGSSKSSTPGSPTVSYTHLRAHETVLD